MPLIFSVLGLDSAFGLILFSCVISGIELHLLWNWKVFGYVLVPSCALAAVARVLFQCTSIILCVPYECS